MTSAEFDVILEQRMVEMRRVLGLKAGEYASDKDRLHNFKQAAAEFPAGMYHNDTPVEALVGMMRKHWASIMDLVRYKALGRVYTDAMVDEKIGDAINYLVLLEAILKEKT